MKANGSMLGGSVRRPHFPAYADYFLKFLDSYAAEGVPVDAVTVQNEVDTDQDGLMPACLWGQESETRFIAEHLGPKLAARNVSPKIWLLDHNYNLWGRALSQLSDPRLSSYVEGVAWHGYAGQPESMTSVHSVHPAKHAYWTEGGPEHPARRHLSDRLGVLGRALHQHSAQLGTLHHHLEPGARRKRTARTSGRSNAAAWSPSIPGPATSFRAASIGP